MQTVFQKDGRMVNFFVSLAGPPAQICGQTNIIMDITIRVDWMILTLVAFE